MAELSLIPYDPAYKTDWDCFVETSGNGTFLHCRDYLEYHSDRFPDASLMAFRDGKLYALLPATFDGHTFSSHAGLTYAGLIINQKATTADVLSLMEKIRSHAVGMGADTFIYRPTPHIYHRLPSEEDLYALFRMDARIVARNVSATIDNDARIKLRADRKAGMRKALEAGIVTEESDNYAEFWEILSENLMERYGAQPVHTLEEIVRLKRHFPSDIHLHTASLDGKILGGCVIYETNKVAHTQYISATPEGKRLHALDLLLGNLITEYGSRRPYFDFGTSNENGGRYLNENLISQKEGFGGRAIVYDTYSIPLK